MLVFVIEDVVASSVLLLAELNLPGVEVIELLGLIVVVLGAEDQILVKAYIEHAD
jgi:membrane-bound ClpP family serine protease